MKKTELQILSDWIDETNQITRALLKEKILQIQCYSRIKPKINPSETPRFVKPTIQEIMDYCVERKNSVDAGAFFDFYITKGWLVGKSPMKDWKAAIRNWERNKIKNSTNGSNDIPRINRQSEQDIRQNSTGWGAS